MSEADSHAAPPAQAGFKRVIATASSTAIIESRPI